MKVILASGSPRRRDLLREIFDTFEVVVADVDETPIPGENPWQIVERLAESKARAVHARYPDALVIGGDTLVALKEEEWQVLGKPLDPADARAMLTRLSGRDHVVVTGVCIASSKGVRVFSDTTHVAFRALEPEEIVEYVATGEPLDKAGSYAIQGGAASFVKSIEGSLTNVIGLPLEKVRENLTDAGFGQTYS